MGEGKTEGLAGGDAARRGGRARWLPLAAVALCLAVAVGYCAAKRGYFVDEVWSYGYANSHYARVLSDTRGGDLSGATLTRQDLLDYVSVGEGERMDAGSVLHNQEGDLHPPLFGLALNAASSLAPGTWSKWAGLGLNLACHAVALVALWALLRELGCSPAASACGVALWGLSRAGLSDVLYIRMYEMLTALTLLLALELAALMRGGASGGARRLLPPAVGATVFLGLMTQYYFAVYALLACLAAGTHLLRRRRLGEAGALAACAWAGVGLFLLAWPPALSHLGAGGATSGTSGEGALASLLDVSGWPIRIVSFGSLVVKDMVVTVLALILIVWPTVHLKHKDKEKTLSPIALSIVAPALLGLLIICLVAPYLSSRYLYNFLSIIVVGVALYLNRWIGSAPTDRQRRRAALTITATLVALLVLNVAIPPQYLGEKEFEQQELMARYADDPCVYIIGHAYKDIGKANFSITTDMPQLMGFGDVHVETDPASAGIASYLASKGDPGEVVLYVDVYPRVDPLNRLSGERVADEVATRLGYSQVTLIKSNKDTDDLYDLSLTYLLRR